MRQRTLGGTGIRVSELGFGARLLGDPELEERAAERLVNTLVDAGITLFDTARSYGRSEERLGRYLRKHRDKVVISSKVGYDIEGTCDWTGECVRRGVDAALARLGTEMIDIVHLHSCNAEVLRRGEVIGALEKARAAGKLRAIGYSGDNAALSFAVSSGRFDVIEASINMFDQRALESAVPTAIESRMGVIAKRPLANAPWRFFERPHAHYAETYWLRMLAMDVKPPVNMSFAELALRYTLSLPSVHTAIVGVSDLHHLEENVRYVQRGSLEPSLVDHIGRAFARVGARWQSEL